MYFFFFFLSILHFIPNRKSAAEELPISLGRRKIFCIRLLHANKDIRLNFAHKSHDCYTSLSEAKLINFAFFFFVNFLISVTKHTANARIEALIDM